MSHKLVQMTQSMVTMMSDNVVQLHTPGQLFLKDVREVAVKHLEAGMDMITMIGILRVLEQNLIDSLAEEDEDEFE